MLESGTIDPRRYAEIAYVMWARCAFSPEAGENLLERVIRMAREVSPGLRDPLDGALIIWSNTPLKRAEAEFIAYTLLDYQEKLGNWGAGKEEIHSLYAAFLERFVGPAVPESHREACLEALASVRFSQGSATLSTKQYAKLLVCSTVMPELASDIASVLRSNVNTQHASVGNMSTSAWLSSVFIAVAEKQEPTSKAERWLLEAAQIAKPDFKKDVLPEPATLVRTMMQPEYKEAVDRLKQIAGSTSHSADETPHIPALIELTPADAPFGDRLRIVADMYEKVRESGKPLDEETIKILKGHIQ